MLCEVLLTIKFFSSTNFFKNFFFLAVIAEWNNLDISIHNYSFSCHIFKNLILKFIRPEPNRISSTQNFEDLKLLIKLDFLLPHTAHFDGDIGLPSLVFNIFESTLSASFLYFKQ